MEKRPASEQELTFIIAELFEDALHNLFIEIHSIIGSKHGDIDLAQVLEKERLSKELISLITEQVWQNIE